ncbi:hypothetical protein ACFWBV_35460 [Streptomyces sp. NPDC060030]|uniref:hypothetical protein n=1 Tax=Streptomyces sp. NPDC060030 TaxID=3347042 RepID=UPI0036C85555
MTSSGVAGELPRVVGREGLDLVAVVADQFAQAGLRAEPQVTGDLRTGLNDVEEWVDLP